MRPRSSTAATPMAFVQAILTTYRKRGMDPTGWLAMAQITPSDIDNPAARITAWQMEQISEAAMRELDDEALGWFSRRLPWGSYGMLARASISSPNLGVALKRWCRHHGLLTDDIGLTLSVNGSTACIGITERTDLGPVREFCLVSVLRNIHGLACWMVDSRIPLQGAQFPFPAPTHWAAYSILFSGSSLFSKHEAAVFFDSSYLALPLLRDESALQHMLQHALPLTVLQYRRDRLLVQRVRQLLLTSLDRIHHADAVAHALAISTRTLHRQLKEEGSSLQALKDEVRRDMAQALLSRTNRPIKQVAEASGFLNEKSFIRAFKGWTGLTPGEFREPTPNQPPGPRTH